jgi:excisionase family DNA binding protein
LFSKTNTQRRKKPAEPEVKKSPKVQPSKLLTVRQLMTVEQCAEFLGVEVATLYVWSSQHKIPVRKLGAHRGAALRFDLDEII